MSDEPWKFSDWYEANKDAFNASRRRRYREDEEFREKIRVRKRRVREKHRQFELQERKQASLVRPHRGWKIVSEAYRADGTVVPGPAYTTGVLASILGCSLQTIRAWLLHGKITVCPLRSSRGDRVYTAEMIERIVAEIGSVTPRPRKTPVSFVTLDYGDGRVETTRMYRIQALAEALGRTRDSIIALESKGRFPDTPFRSSGKQRLYTYGMIIVAVEAFDRLNARRGEEEWRSLFTSILSGWKTLGVLKASMTEIGSL